MGDNVVLTALKKAEDSDALLLRFYEWAGKTADVQISLPQAASSASFTNLMEQPEGQQLSVTNHQVTIPVHPYEIVSVRVDFAKHHSSQP
jgi:alpha-mannosidase